MKKKVILLTFLFVGTMLISCEQAVDPLNDKGKIFVASDPEEASIYVDGRNSGKFTPADVELTAGIHHITLKKLGYADYHFTDTVVIGVETSTTDIKMTKYGILFINSEPSSAKIYINEENTLEVTPKTFSKADGIYSITLKVEDHADTTFDVLVKDSKDVDINVNLRGEFLTYFGGRVLYDTTNSAANEPSGLSFSTGNALNIDSKSGQKALADIIFVPNEFGSFDVKTPNGTNGMFRDTRFFVSKSKNINDGVNSPIEDPTWRNSFTSTTDNYVFAYDADGHYSKIQIVRRSENPNRIEVKWIYNDNSFDSRF